MKPDIIADGQKSLGVEPITERSILSSAAHLALHRLPRVR